MIYKKRLNNNVVVAEDSQGHEKILMGCGLGFQIKEGTPVDESKVEKVFALTDSQMNEQLKELLQSIPMKYVQFADEFLNYAREHTNKKISENVIISLCDHIYMAVERKKQGIDVKNVLLWDIQRYYRDEYESGEYAVQLINERFGVQLTNDEAGFIALHIVNGQMELPSQNIQEITVLIQEIETIIRMTFDIKMDMDSVYYCRLITHLKFFAERLFSGKNYEGESLGSLEDIIKTQYPEAHRCCEKISKFINHKYHYTLSGEEISYLSIHIARIIQVTAAGDKQTK